MSTTQDQEYANDLVAGVRKASDIKRTVQEERALAIAKFQKDSFPGDPILLYELQVVFVDGGVNTYYALPDEDMLNPEYAQKPVYLDIIQGDGLTPMAFINCSVVVSKRVFCTIDEIRPTSLMVFDKEMDALRASKVLLGLPGMAKKPQEKQL